MENTSRPSFWSRHEFLIRRLHSLSGLIPVGAYMVVHLLTNATVLDSPATFQDKVNTIHGLGKALPLVEWMFIFIPILFHGLVGLVMIRGAVPNTSSYKYAGNIRYTLQRATGMIAFAFIVWHVIHMHGTLGAPLKEVRVFPLPNGAARFDPERATSSAAAAIRGLDDVDSGNTGSNITGLGIQVLYAIGILSCVYHLANGLWTMGITWGLWTTPAAQRRANWISVAFGLFLAAVGLSALVGMSRVNLVEARAVEKEQAADRAERERKIKRIEKQVRPPANQAAGSK